MLLLVEERLALLQLLPEQGSLMTIRIVRELREALSFTEDEHELYKFKQTGNRLDWKNAEVEKEVDIGAQAMGIIADLLLDLHAKGTVRVEHLTLFDKFKVEPAPTDAPVH